MHINFFFFITTVDLISIHYSWRVEDFLFTQLKGLQISNQMEGDYVLIYTIVVKYFETKL
jgi:hypothetical protein